MIQRLNLSVPFSHLSLAQVSFNIVRELYRRKVQCAIFPRGNVDLSAFTVDKTFGGWLEQSVNNRYKKVDRKVPTLNIWHINGSEFRLSDKQYTLSFHETDSPTEHEVNIVNQQDFTFFSSSWSVDNFRSYGAQNVGFVPLGLDEDFKPTSIPTRDTIHWICVGKYEEMRKMTTLKIQAWIKKYGGNRAHQLTLCVNNPFFRPEDMNALYQRAFNGNKPFNVNVLPHLKTNAEMNQLYNSADIDISGISRSEGFNIPAHTATALGKWSVVTNVTAHKDWATAENSILIEPTGMVPAVDNIFFHKGAPFSQGNFYDFTIDSIVEAFDRAEKKAKIPNESGRNLATEQTYKRTVDQILVKIEADSV
jgi:hypothetical protein